MKLDFAKLEAIASQRLYTLNLVDLLTRPLKFPAPARRRRSDREIPKAA